MTAGLEQIISRMVLPVPFRAAWTDSLPNWRVKRDPRFPTTISAACAVGIPNDFEVALIAFSNPSGPPSRIMPRIEVR